MLYNCFRVSLMLASLLAIIHMVECETYLYMYFPIAIWIWGIFSFFEEGDKEYRRRNGGSSGWSFWDEDYYGGTSYYNGNTYNRAPYRSDYSRYAPPGDTLKKREYKKIAKMCNRTFKITVAKDDMSNDIQTKRS